MNLVGTTIEGRFHIVSELGSGGMGTVYLAEQPELNRRVAIKVMHAPLSEDREGTERFLREGKILTELDDPGIVSVYCFGILQTQQPYLAMEFVDGVSVRQLLNSGDLNSLSESGANRNSIEWRRATSLVIEVCKAMEAAHKAGIVHRDLKPDNIISLKGTSEKIKIIDFGLGAFLAGAEQRKTLTATGLLVGSVHYMSPEQCQGKRADARSDIYSVACILYEMVAGKPPFDADFPVGILFKHSNETCQPLSELLPKESLPKGLDSVLARGLEKDPDKRYQTMKEFGQHLKLVLDGKENDLPPELLSWKPAAHRSSRVALVLFLSCAALVIAVVFAFQYARTPTAREPDLLQETPHRAMKMKKLMTETSVSSRSASELIDDVAAFTDNGHHSQAQQLVREWIKYRQQAKTLTPDDITISSQLLAKIHLHALDNQAAIAILESALKQVNEDKRTTSEQKISLLSSLVPPVGWLGKKENARAIVTQFEDILRSDHDLSTNQIASVLYQIGECKIIQHDWDEALKSFDEALSRAEAAQFKSTIERSRCICFLWLGRIPEARQAAKEGARLDLLSLSLKPSTHEKVRAEKLLSSCAEQAYRWDVAVENLDHIYAEYPNMPDKTRAFILMDHATWSVLKWSGKNRNNGPILDRESARDQWLATVEKATKDCAEAYRTFSRRKERIPARESLVLQASSMLLMGKEAEADELLKRALERSSDESENDIRARVASAMWCRGSLAELSGWLPESVLMYRRAKDLYAPLEEELYALPRKQAFSTYEKAEAAARSLKQPAN